MGFSALVSKLAKNGRRTQVWTPFGSTLIFSIHFDRDLVEDFVRSFVNRFCAKNVL